MKIDLHIHSKDCSDGKMTLTEIFEEASKREIGLISIADHDAIQCQDRAQQLAAEYGIRYISGVELNISFSHPHYRRSKAVSLDVLGYQYDIENKALSRKTQELRDHRKHRAEQILEKINVELEKEGLKAFTHEDLNAIEETVDGAFGRPHIADYMIKQGLVSNKQEAFDKYLVKCNVPKLPVTLEEASELIRGAGGKVVLAHPNDPNGTSLVSLTDSIEEQHFIIKDSMLEYIDGVECWHSRHTRETSDLYAEFAKERGLMTTGGSDCHQQPVIMGTVPVPSYVAGWFGVEGP